MRIILKDSLEGKMLKDYDREIGEQKKIVNSRAKLEDRQRAQQRIVELETSANALKGFMSGTITAENVMKGGYSEEDKQRFEGMTGAEMLKYDNKGNIRTR